MLLLERVHERQQATVLVGHYDLVDVVQEDVTRPVHGPVNAVVQGGLLAEVVHVAATLGEEPAIRRSQVLVYGPGDDLHEALLAVAAQQAVQLWAAAGVVDNHPVHAQQPAQSKIKGFARSWC